MSRFQAPTGTRDLLPPESAHFAALVGQFAQRAHLAGYGLVVSPMFEDAGVFRHGVGEVSDVVTKEMYEFEDKGGRLLALRPEGTASIVRAFVQHRPQTPWKVWYVTPAFRYERPQAGRYRQHHQLGVEALGTDDPDLDVEVIALLNGFLAATGLRRTELHLNSLGDATCRPVYRQALVAFLEAHAGELCDEHTKTWEKNPLRVLDCRRPACQALRSKAPRMRDFLCDECAAHFARVTEGLEVLGIEFILDDFLVRGLDYYTRTTFEFASLSLDAAQNGIGGGGRYDGLSESLGGPATPGIGFGTGIERVLLACAAEGLIDENAIAGAVEVFVVDVAGGDTARMLTAALRNEGIATDRSFDGRSLKSQLKAADRSGATIAVLAGTKDTAPDTVVVRVLRGEGAGSQQVTNTDELVGYLKGVLQ